MKFKLDKKILILDYRGSKYKIKNCSTLEEIKMDVYRRFNLEVHTFEIEYLDSDGVYYAADDYDDLKDSPSLRIQKIDV